MTSGHWKIITTTTQVPKWSTNSGDTGWIRDESCIYHRIIVGECEAIAVENPTVLFPVCVYRRILVESSSSSESSSSESSSESSSQSSSSQISSSSDSSSLSDSSPSSDSSSSSDSSPSSDSSVSSLSSASSDSSDSSSSLSSQSSDSTQSPSSASSDSSDSSISSISSQSLSSQSQSSDSSSQSNPPASVNLNFTFQRSGAVSCGLTTPAGTSVSMTYGGSTYTGSTTLVGDTYNFTLSKSGALWYMTCSNTAGCGFSGIGVSTNSPSLFGSYPDVDATGGGSCGCGILHLIFNGITVS